MTLLFLQAYLKITNIPILKTTNISRVIYANYA